MYNHVHNVLRHFDREQIFFSPQMKRRVKISNKHGIYKLPHELPNDTGFLLLGKLLCPHKKKKKSVRLKKLGNIGESLKLHRILG